MGSGGMSGVVTRSYKAGSIVYFEGDKSEYIYILKAGRIRLTYIRPETGEEIKEDIKQGEFFGVKSALGKYPREETAQTLSDTVILQLRLDDFERIVLGNIQVVKKMLRVFSNQLRRIGKAVREVLGETNSVNPAAELFKIAEYYYQNGRPEQALYAYKKYLEYYPNTQFAQPSMQRIKDIQAGNYSAPPVDTTPVPAAVSAAPSSDDFFSAPSGGDDFSTPLSAPSGGEPGDMVDFDFDDAPGGHSELTSEMDTFLSGDDEMMSLPSAAPSFAERMNEARDLFSSGDFQGSMDKFRELAAEPDPSEPGDTALWEEAKFQIGACYYSLGQLKEAMSELALFVKNNPQSKFAKNAFLYTGFVFEKAGAKDKAAPYYKKAASMPPKDDVTAQAMSRLKALGM